MNRFFIVLLSFILSSSLSRAMHDSKTSAKQQDESRQRGVKREQEEQGDEKIAKKNRQDLPIFLDKYRLMSTALNLQGQSIPRSSENLRLPPETFSNSANESSSRIFAHESSFGYPRNNTSTSNNSLTKLHVDYTDKSLLSGTVAASARPSAIQEKNNRERDAVKSLQNPLENNQRERNANQVPVPNIPGNANHLRENRLHLAIQRDDANEIDRFLAADEDSN